MALICLKSMRMSVIKRLLDGNILDDRGCSLLADDPV
jgi:hypothetical protein